MKTFSEYLNEAEKKMTFKQTVNHYFEMLDFDNNFVFKRPTFSSINEQKGVFGFVQNFYFRTNDDYDANLNFFEERQKKIVKMLNIKSKAKKTNDAESLICYVYKKKISDNVNLVYKTRISLKRQIIDEFVFTGKKVKDKNANVDYTEFPEYKVGEILYTTYGYDMTNVDFFQIVKRSGKRLYVQEINKKVVSGSAGYNGKAVAVKNSFVKDSEVFTSNLPNTKIDGNRAYLWDGTPKYFNYMD